MKWFLYKVPAEYVNAYLNVQVFYLSMALLFVFAIGGEFTILNALISILVTDVLFYRNIERVNKDLL